MAMAVVWHNVGFELSRSMHEEIDKTVLLGYPTLEELFNKNIELFQSVFLDILNDRVDGESSFDLLGFKEGFSELIIIKRASNSIVLPNHVLHLLNANPNLLRVIEYIIERCFEMIN